MNFLHVGIIRISKISIDGCDSWEFSLRVIFAFLLLSTFFIVLRWQCLRRTLLIILPILVQEILRIVKVDCMQQQSRLAGRILCNAEDEE